MLSQVNREPRFWTSLLFRVIICITEDNYDYEKVWIIKTQSNTKISKLYNLNRNVETIKKTGNTKATWMDGSDVPIHAMWTLIKPGVSHAKKCLRMRFCLLSVTPGLFFSLTCIVLIYFFSKIYNTIMNSCHKPFLNSRNSLHFPPMRAKALWTYPDRGADRATVGRLLSVPQMLFELLKDRDGVSFTTILLPCMVQNT